jgi:hypothetical protein
MLYLCIGICMYCNLIVVAGMADSRKRSSAVSRPSSVAATVPATYDILGMGDDGDAHDTDHRIALPSTTSISSTSSNNRVSVGTGGGPPRTPAPPSSSSAMTATIPANPYDPHPAAVATHNDGHNNMRVELGDVAVSATARLSMGSVDFDSRPMSRPPARSTIAAALLPAHVNSFAPFVLFMVLSIQSFVEGKLCQPSNHSLGHPNIHVCM